MDRYGLNSHIMAGCAPLPLPPLPPRYHSIHVVRRSLLDALPAARCRVTFETEDGTCPDKSLFCNCKCSRLGKLPSIVVIMLLSALSFHSNVVKLGMFSLRSHILDGNVLVNFILDNSNLSKEVIL
jgi:hypothetical protein